jgi:hypothetical protein
MKIYFKSYFINVDVESIPGNYKWVHCDEFFTGYYMMDYSAENWGYLAGILKAQNPVS